MSNFDVLITSQQHMHNNGEVIVIQSKSQFWSVLGFGFHQSFLDKL